MKHKWNRKFKVVLILLPAVERSPPCLFLPTLWINLFWLLSNWSSGRQQLGGVRTWANCDPHLTVSTTIFNRSLISETLISAPFSRQTTGGLTPVNPPTPSSSGFLHCVAVDDEEQFSCQERFKSQSLIYKTLLRRIYLLKGQNVTAAVPAAHTSIPEHPSASQPQSNDNSSLLSRIIANIWTKLVSGRLLKTRMKRKREADANVSQHLWCFVWVMLESELQS